MPCAFCSLRTVHPRWRGEQPVLFAGMDYVGGSSPLARGTEMFETSKRYAERFIPAGAGNSESGRHGDAKQPVHPRWRGEQVRCIAPSPAGRGSSPLARGTGCPGYGYFAAGRFIPAGAGNRLALVSLHRQTPVHPRWRGEQGDYGKPGVDVGGSSPLARGTGRRQCSLNRRRSVHPRWRGEQVKVPREANWPIGSSPLARGTG